MLFDHTLHCQLHLLVAAELEADLDKYLCHGAFSGLFLEHILELEYW